MPLICKVQGICNSSQSVSYDKNFMDVGLHPDDSYKPCVIGFEIVKLICHIFEVLTVPSVGIMIVAKQKPINEIVKMLEGTESVLVVGCNGCTGVYQVGGKKEADILKARLLESTNIKANVITVPRQCDRQMSLASVQPLVGDYEAVLSTACGVGVQILAEIFRDKTVIPANNTMFIGMREKELGKFYEYCKACGDCILFETGGICPVTKCAKGMMNGPCGGCVDGKCEVSFEVRDETGKIAQTIKNDCAWYLMYAKLKQTGMLNSFSMYRSPRDRSISDSPRMF